MKPTLPVRSERFSAPPRMMHLLPILLLALLAAACTPQQGSGAASRLVRTGNQAFAKQAFEEALQEYRAAQAQAPERAEPYYNAANALYRQGKYAEALREIQQAVDLASGTDSGLAPDGFYNAGNSAFQTENWLGAAESYKQALLRNPADQDAKHNLELALQKLVENQQSQDQNQDGQQDQDQNQDQNQDQEEQQQKDPSQEQEQQQEDRPSEDGQDQQQEQKPERSEDGQEKAQPEQSENGQEQPDPQGQPQQEPPPDQQGEQREGQPQPGNQPPQPPRPGQTPPQGPGQRMTPEQARQLLAAIARQSDTLQDRLGEVLAVRGRPPVQDW